MNIFNKALLRLALLPAPFYRGIGVDTVKLKAIVTTKLVMDDRRPAAMLAARRRKKEKQVSMATLATMFISALFGFALYFVFYIGADEVTHFTLYYTVFFFMLSLMLISDFTSVLIDVRDNAIILPKPVNDRTFVVARLLHIFIHLCKVVVPLSLGGVVYCAIHYKVYGVLLFLLLVLFTTAIAILFINALYILILRFTSPQRFQSIIGYVQIFFSMFMYGGYQIFPRMIDRFNLESLTFTTKPAMAFFPIYWLGNTFTVLFHFSGTATEVALAAAGFVFPFMAVVVVVRYLAPSFNRKLAMINSGTVAPVKAATVITSSTSYAHRMAQLVTSTPAEKAGFLFTWRMTARSRDFKVKVYPAIGYLAVYIVVFLMNNHSLSLSDLQGEIGKGKGLILSALYFTSYLLMIAIGQIIYTEKFKAAWVYYSLPVARPGELISGATKATILKFYLPIVTVITVAAVVLIGPAVLPNIILGLFNEVLIVAVLVSIGNKHFPFSLQQATNVKTGTFLRSLAILFISGLIGFGHYLIYSILPAVAVCVVLSAIASWLLMGSIKNTGWEQIKSTYASGE